MWTTVHIISLLGVISLSCMADAQLKLEEAAILTPITNLSVAG